jgi:Fe2+ or Zn2+ uptake regulation protein
MIAIEMHKKRQKVGMDIVAEVLLAMIIHKESGTPVMVMVEKATNNGVASQATVHRALEWLREKKYIDTIYKDDLRTKYLVPTNKGLRHFKEKK